MDLKDMLPADTIDPSFNAHNSDAVLERIADISAHHPLLAKHPPATVLAALRERESRGSTGFTDGIAIPHCGFGGLGGFALGIVLVPEGVEFGAAGGGPSSIFFFPIGDSEDRTGHIQLLSSISVFLKEEENRDFLLRARSAREIHAYVSEHLHVQTQDGAGPFCLFEVFVQNTSYFEDILQIFASNVDGSVTVLDLKSAGSYLHPLPLFSALWTRDAEQETKLIRGIVKKSQVNDVIRRINTIESGILSRPGVLVAVQDLFYAAGSIDF